jgi:hypothetical protein
MLFQHAISNIILGKKYFFNSRSILSDTLHSSRQVKQKNTNSHYLVHLQIGTILLNYVTILLKLWDNVALRNVSIAVERYQFLRSRAIRKI